MITYLTGFPGKTLIAAAVERLWREQGKHPMVLESPTPAELKAAAGKYSDVLVCFQGKAVPAEFDAPDVLISIQRGKEQAPERPVESPEGPEGPEPRDPPLDEKLSGEVVARFEIADEVELCLSHKGGVLELQFLGGVSTTSLCFSAVQVRFMLGYFRTALKRLEAGQAAPLQVEFEYWPGSEEEWVTLSVGGNDGKDFCLGVHLGKEFSFWADWRLLPEHVVLLVRYMRAALPEMEESDRREDDAAFAAENPDVMQFVGGAWC